MPLDFFTFHPFAILRTYFFRIYSCDNLFAFHTQFLPFQVGVCCIAPPLIHILNNQELCRRVFGGKLCFNVPSSPYEPTHAARRSYCYNKNAFNAPSTHFNIETSRRNTQKLNVQFGVNNRAFDYEV